MMSCKNFYSKACLSPSFIVLFVFRVMRLQMSLDPTVAQYKAVSMLQTGVVTGVSGTQEDVQVHQANMMR